MNTIYKQGEHHDCPFCQSSNTDETSNGMYICKDCERHFDFNDTILEPVRHRISAVLSANHATEENPFPCDMILGEMYPDAQGTSTLELPHLTSIFETQDGVIYFNIEEYSEPIEFDGMCLEDLVNIADEIN